ncbi:hypothetical protein CcaCcLH18_05200 [Colletotrichum camelliae]|nr:hypothetical protein CcaCcLH18_05200 [Colletotrichum camelliae]
MSPEQDSPKLTSLDQLRRIDKLRELNIGSYLPLPQLVAVGDQSSGKSSLLESLCGIPFPHGQELCTRYATQITHHREESRHIDISVIPGPNATPAHKEKLRSYTRQVQTTKQLRSEFEDILAQVDGLMDINTASNVAGENTFSEDVLKIEKYGPDEDHLTIIDVPGIFRNTTEGVTTNGDKELVKSMVKRYIKDSRTIILAILPSNVDVATQEILTLAAEADPAGDRTLGILTKADLLKENTAKAAVVSLVEGKRKTLKLGYHIVTNRGGDDAGEEDDTVASLRQREAMFDDQPWNDISRGRIGVQALRERLADLLGEITDRAFPKLRTETRHRLRDAEKRLQELGAPRRTELEQRQYLAGVVSDFQSLARDALDANYSAHAAFDRNDFRLITAVANLTDQYNSDFSDLGRTYLFESETQPRVQALAIGTPLLSQAPGPAVGTFTPAPATPAFATDDEGEENSTNDSSAAGLTSFDIPDPSDYPDLEKIIVTDWDIQPPKRGIMEWIEAVHLRSRALELGTLSPKILSSVFREQSAKWEVISKQYISKVILVIHRFIVSGLQTVCADLQVARNISSTMMGNICAKYEASIAQLNGLLSVERDLTPYTLNHYFNHNQQKSHGTRMKDTMLRTANYDENLGKRWIYLDDVSRAITDKSNTAYTKETIHDTLQAYYKVALKRFVDNVYLQAVSQILLFGPGSPHRLLSPRWVLELDAETLRFIAGESRSTRDYRERLTKEIHDLGAAMKILR